MLARVVAVAAAGLLAVAGTGIVLKLSARPAHAACSVGGGGGIGHTGSGDGIHLTGGNHHRPRFGAGFAHNAAIIHAAYQGGRDRPRFGRVFEAFVALPTGVHQGRNAAR
ncbi:MAG: hypothetical protein U1E53_30020 [Dongiaceae bacterium]